MVKISVLQMIVMKPNYKLCCESSSFGSKLKLMDAKRVKSSGCAEKRNLPRGKKNSAQRKRWHYQSQLRPSPTHGEALMQSFGCFSYVLQKKNSSWAYPMCAYIYNYLKIKFFILVVLRASVHFLVSGKVFDSNSISDQWCHAFFEDVRPRG